MLNATLMFLHFPLKLPSTQRLLGMIFSYNYISLCNIIGEGLAIVSLSLAVSELKLSQFPF